MIAAMRNAFGRNTDILLVVLVLGVLTVLFVPIPSALLDFLLLLNFSLALVVLMLTFYMAKPVEFSTFPSLLLIATLFRLSLNIAATRLILSDGDAGRVIGAIGSYVVGGNYVIGLIVFLILVVVQYVVVTSGAQRVSEVAARFTLDSMPGQQMSIDADLNMGFIDQEEAKRRRKNLEKEAGFYGAMDGASKFVKGDAVAGIVILLINIIGGLVIGVMQMNLPWGEALHTYTLLTIGDGIVTQVPALVISVGTGIIVTRSSSDTQLSHEVVRQVTSFPKTLFIAAGALGVLLLLPGMPLAQGVTLIAVLGAIAAFSLGAKKSEAERAKDAKSGGSSEDSGEAEGYAALKVEPIEVHMGVGLLVWVNDDSSLFMDRIAAFRKQYGQESGLVLPKVRVREGAKLAPNAYEICVFGVPVGRGEIVKDRWLAIHGGAEGAKKLAGVEARDPTYGLPATWIEEGDKEAARAMRWTVVDASTVLLTHLSETLKRQSATLLTRAETDRILARVKQTEPGLVEDLVPTVLAVSDIQKVLQSLLKEGVTIRNVEAILEALAEGARASKDPGHLLELARQKLGPAICHPLVSDSRSLHVLTLDPAIEQGLYQSIRAVETHTMLIVEPKFAEQIMTRLAAQAERMMKSNLLPVLLCSPDLRRHVRTLSERVLPHLRVLSVAEVPNGLDLKSFGTVTL